MAYFFKAGREVCVGPLECFVKALEGAEVREYECVGVSETEEWDDVWWLMDG